MTEYVRQQVEEALNDLLKERGMIKNLEMNIQERNVEIRFLHKKLKSIRRMIDDVLSDHKCPECGYNCNSKRGIAIHKARMHK